MLQDDTPHERIHPQLLRVVTHYAGIAGARMMPPQIFFRPADLHWLYGCFYAVDLLADEQDYRFGFCGPCWELFYGRDLTGRRLSEIENDLQLQDRRADFDAVVAARRPNYSTGRMIWNDGKCVRFERLTLPFSGRCGHVSMLLVAAQSEIAPWEVHHLKLQGYPQVVLEDTVWPEFVHSADQSERNAVRSL